MKHALLDLNVILDHFLFRKPFYKQSEEIIAYSFKKKIKLYVCSLSLANGYYILRQENPHEEVVSKLLLYASGRHPAWAKIIAVEEKVMMQA